MRGSPLFRTLFLSLLLLTVGAAFLRITRSQPLPAAPAPQAPGMAPQAGTLSVPFDLTLSAPAAEITLSTPAGTPLFRAASPETLHHGLLDLPAETSALVLQVRWAAGTAGHRFAKLTIEPPTKPTLRHVFDAAGDLDDVWELPAGALSPASHD